MRYVFFLLFFVLSTATFSQTCQTLTSESFEQGLGSWTDGGFFVDRVNGPACDGSFSIRIRNDEVPGSSLTSPTLDLSDADSILISVSARGDNLDQSFPGRVDIQISDDGINFSTITSISFIFEGSCQVATFAVVSTFFSADSKIRFQGELSGSETAYIDDIEIMKCVSAPSHCSDGAISGDETGLDCGGSCSICPCDGVDGTKNVVTTSEDSHYQNSLDFLSAGLIGGNSVTFYTAGNFITFQDDYTIENGTQVTLKIEPCQ